MSAAEIAAATGLYLLEHSTDARRNFVQEQMDDLRDRAKDTYDAAKDRASNRSKSFGKEESNGGWHIMRFVVGLGIGVGVGLLMAPASGEDTRAKIAEKAHDFGDRARHCFGPSDYAATGTGD